MARPVDTVPARVTEDGAVLVSSVSATVTDAIYDSDGNLASWVENGVAYQATYDADGNLLSQGPAA